MQGVAAVVSLVLAVAVGVPAALPVAAATEAGVPRAPAAAPESATPSLHVSSSGTDTPGCGPVDGPCATIGHAVALAAPGDTIEVAPGSYPEHVVLDRSLTLRGANAGVPAGTDGRQRGPESVIKGLDYAPAAPPSADDPGPAVDGFRIEPLGDQAFAPGGTPLVRERGGARFTAVNNVFDGDLPAGPCAPLCTGTAVGAIDATSGEITVSDNSFEGFQQVVTVRADPGLPPPSVVTIERNAFRHIGGTALRLGSAADVQPTQAVRVSRNLVDGTPIPASGPDAALSPDSREPAAPPVPGADGLVVRSGHTIIEGNLFVALRTGVRIEVCDAVDTRDIVLLGNRFASGVMGVDFSDAARATPECAPTTPPPPGRLPGGDVAGAVVAQNAFSGNTWFAIGGSHLTRSPTPKPLDARCNWFGTADGPGLAPPDVVEGAVTYVPWLTGPDPGSACTGGLPGAAPAPAAPTGASDAPAPADPPGTGDAPAGDSDPTVCEAPSPCDGQVIVAPIAASIVSMRQSAPTATMAGTAGPDGECDGGPIVLRGRSIDACGELHEITVVNAHGNDAPWTLHGSVTDFVDGTQALGTRCDADGEHDNHCIPGGNLGWIPRARVADEAVPRAAAAVEAGPPVGAPVGGPGRALDLSAGIGGTPHVLCGAPAGRSNGTFACSARLLLSVPAAAAAGTYRAVIHLTLT